MSQRERMRDEGRIEERDDAGDTSKSETRIFKNQAFCIIDVTVIFSSVNKRQTKANNENSHGDTLILVLVSIAAPLLLMASQ